jgi:hypothetical protein
LTPYKASFSVNRMKFVKVAKSYSERIAKCHGRSSLTGEGCIERYMYSGVSDRFGDDYGVYLLEDWA